MRRGNERLEMLRSGIGVPRERIVGLPAGKKIAGDDPQIPLFMEPVMSESLAQEATAPETTVETHAHAGGCCEIAGCGNVTNASVGALSNCKVPRLVHKKVKAGGRVPRTLVWRSRSAAIVEEPESIQPPLPEPPIVQQEQAPHPAPAEKSPAKQVATVVIPTPRKTRERTPKLEEREASPAPAPKPLKVIRRRREETPKIFETAAKSFPKAMLEGVNVELGDNNHRQID